MGDMVVADVKERPILFSGEMVRAILDGRKTQTRRVVKPQPDEISVRVIDDKCAEVIWSDPKHLENRGGGTRDGGRDILQSMVYERCRYGRPGDRLWVRETFTDAFTENDHGHKWAAYRSDGEMIDHATGERSAFVVDLHWRPSIFMPRWASRITLEVVSVRVERVQEINDAGAMAEGITLARHELGTVRGLGLGGAPVLRSSHASKFVALWDSINGERAPWASNPWVWVVEFKRVAA